MKLNKEQRRKRIHNRIRKKIKGTAACPRISVFRSNKNIYAQIIDDIEGKTIVATSSKDGSISAEATNVAIATEVGKLLAQKATEEGISSVVFDRSGYLFHGRIKALADGAREGGLKF